MPIQQFTLTNSSLFTRNGLIASSRTASAKSSASLIEEIECVHMANSSPPIRYNVPLPKIVNEMRCVKSSSSSSPATWPKLSLICLKLSKSIMSRALQIPALNGRKSRANTVCNCRRFGNAVNTSWLARNRNSSRVCTNSDTSVRDKV